jgi:putative ABC transport system permease protein
MGLPAGHLSLDGRAVLIAVAAGLAASFVGGLVPAVRAGRLSPLRAVLGEGELRTRPAKRRIPVAIALAALGIAGVSALATATETSSSAVAAGVAGVLAIFGAVAIAGPFAIRPIASALSWPLRRLTPVDGRLAVDSVRANPIRAAATASGMMFGLALIAASGALAASFLGTVKRDLHRGLVRDFTVQPRDFHPGFGVQQSVAPQLGQRIAQLPGVRVATPERILFVKDLLDGRGGLAVGVDPARYPNVARADYAYGGTDAEVIPRVERGQVVLAEPLSREAGLRPGDAVTLKGPRGRLQTHVAGVVRTTVFAGQAVGMSLGTMRAAYGVTTDTNLAITVRRGANRGRVERAIDTILARDYPQLRLLSNAQIKHDVERQVQQQFVLFDGLLGVCVLISLFGLVNTMGMNVLERTREIGTLRAIGASRWQLRRSIAEEGLLLALVGSLLGVVCGVVVGYVLVRGIERTIPALGYVFPAGTVVGVVIAATALGVVAAVLPARRAARMDVVEALADE